MKNSNQKPKKKVLKLIEESTIFEDNIGDISFNKINLDKIDSDSKNFLNKKELLNRKFISENESKFENLFLYTAEGIPAPNASINVKAAPSGKEAMCKSTLKS